MALQDQDIPIDLGQGVDTKTDPKVVVAGKMLRLENAVFTDPKRISKRNGYNEIAIAGNSRMVHSYNDELISADMSNRLLTYSPSQPAFFPRGVYTSTELKKLGIDQESSGSGFVDSSTLGNYAVYAWSTATNGGSASQMLGSVVDLQSNAVVVRLTALFPSLTMNIIGRPRCVTLGATTLAIIWVDTTFGGIYITKVVFGAPGTVSFAAPVLIDAATNTTAYFDVIATPTGGAVFYQSTTGVSIVTLSAAGVPGVPVNTVDANAYVPLSISLNTISNELWVYWTDATFAGPAVASLGIYYAVYSATLVPVLPKTLITVNASPYAVSNMTARTVDATHQTLYYGVYIKNSLGSVAAPSFIDQTLSATISSAGVVILNGVFAYGVMPYSHIFSALSGLATDQYALFMFRGSHLSVAAPTGTLVQDQPTYFVVKLTGASVIPEVVARFGSGLGNSQGYLLRGVGYTPTVTYVTTNTKVIVGIGIDIQEFKTDFFESSGVPPGALVGSYAYTIDFASENAYRAVNSGELAILNGGLVQAYDGLSPNEFGFHLFPEISEAAPIANGGVGQVGPGTYSYLAIFQWTDAQGNLHQSAPSVPVTAITNGGTPAVLLTVTVNYLTQKTCSSVAIYRTKNGGTVYYLITDPVLLQPAFPGSTFINFIDIESDANINGNPQAYTYPASAVLENSTPPPSMFMVAHNNRLWFADSESHNNIWYTKSFQPLVGLSPSALMTEQIDDKFGDIAALAEMDDKIIFFKENGICLQSGDGVNDTGSGSSLSFPQFVPTDVGCSSQKSIITVPTGVMFQSANGIYQIDRSTSVVYLGMPVEQYNNQNITSAKLIQGKSQIRFLSSNGTTLVYDYIFQQWATFTNHQGLSGDVWQGSYVYARDDGAIYKEVPGFYLDKTTAFSVLAQTSWLALASVQGFQRVRRLAMLGDYQNGGAPSIAGHGIQVSAAYDFNPAPQIAVPFLFNKSILSAVYQYRERLPQQKCDSISLLIQEITTGDSAEYMDLTNMSFEAGIKKGINKMSANQSVG